MVEFLKKSNKIILSFLIVVCLFLTSCASDSSYTESDLLRDVYSDYFRVGAAVTASNVQSYSDILPHFNSVTAEWEMKWRATESKRGTYAYEKGDQIVAWAKAHDTAVRGHCLLWYKSLPSWIGTACTDKDRALEVVDEYVRRTVTHYGDDVYCWDVCNEALKGTVVSADLEEGGNVYRTGFESSSEAGTFDWYALCGVDFIKQAFHSAEEALKEAGAENVQLFYNDFSLNNPYKREACVQLVEMLRAEGIRIDGVGMQAHYNLNTYKKDKEKFMREFEDSVERFTSLGLDVHITELDIQVYSSKSDALLFDSLPYNVEIEQAEMYGDIFAVCRKYSRPQGEGYGVVSSVTTWGVADDHTSQDSDAHKEYPLLFGTDRLPKKAYYEIISF